MSLVFNKLIDSISFGLMNIFEVSIPYLTIIHQFTTRRNRGKNVEMKIDEKLLNQADMQPMS